LLDETTSHLDTECEMLVQQALAHRLSTIRSADTIDAVEDGKFVNIGRQDRRLASSPVYQRLFELQSVDRLD
jgi:ATP-binding cassette subfamily B protein